jgi:Rps23 Pro-64 3,4-dihydroxylase Tpa1-like proline 4-hydroxylase
LVSYYEDSDYYLPHLDVAQFTSLLWFFKEPRCFSGGEFKFSDYEDIIELKHNRMVLFPSWVMHEVSEVKMNDRSETDGYSTYGRYCITNFLYSDNRPNIQGQNPFEFFAQSFN